jgi:hypothetical protein
MYNPQVLILSALVATAAAAPAPEPEAEPHGFYGHVGHGYHGPPCKHVLEEKTKEVCYYEPEKKCETKTTTYKVITGYEKGECKEVEVCKNSPYGHHGYGRRAAAPHYGYVECEKETKEICEQVPTIEEKTVDHEICHYEPKKVCEEKTFQVPTLACEEAEEEAE